MCQNYLKHAETLQEICRLINLKSTGSPKTLARKLEISESTLHRMIQQLSDLIAPIKFSYSLNSYVCTDDTIIQCSVILQALSSTDQDQIKGGQNPFYTHESPFLNFKNYIQKKLSFI